jgi:(p)ppGpp synthase/HD superfamily hydrolase
MSSIHIELRNHLYCFVTIKHFQQKRKYTDEPYFNHVLAVAKMADEMCRFGYEIGLCHDLIEDTDCEAQELHDALERFGYTLHEAFFITNRVVELTDVYISEDFPQLNRAKRKEQEANRLSKISYEAQTVKYFDLIHNCQSIVEHDKGFAKVFLAEANTILKGMNGGNPAIYAKCKRVIKKALKQLENEKSNVIIQG